LNEQISNGVDTFFEVIPEFANSPQEFRSLAKNLQDYIYYNSALKLKNIKQLDIIQSPEESDRDFQIRLLQVSRERRDSEVDKLKMKYAKK
jgi:predicted NACHT family NTPase